MAKFDAAAALGTLALLRSGQLRGQEQARQQQEQQDEDAFRNTLQAFALRRQMDADQQERALAALGPDPSQIPGLRPEARVALLGPYYQRQSEILSRPAPSFEGVIPAGRQFDAYRPLQKPGPAPYGVGLNTPAEQLVPPLPTRAPTPPVSGVTGLQPADFENPEEETARRGLINRAGSILSVALSQGNTDLAQQVEALVGELEGRKVDPATAGTRLATLYAGLQSKTAAATKGGAAENALQWLDQSLKLGTIPQEHLEAASALAGDLAAVDLTTPAGVTAVDALLKRYSDFRRMTPLQPTGTERYNASEADRRKAEGFERTNNQYLTRIQQSKTPGERIRAIHQQHEFAKRTSGVILPYGAEDYSAEPRMVTRRRLRVLTPEEALTGSNEFQASYEDVQEPETPQESKIRWLATATTDLTDPVAKAKAQQALFKDLLAFVKSPNFAALPEEQQAQWVNSLNEAGDAIGAPDIPQLHPGVSPNTKAMVAERVLDRNLAKQRLNLSNRYFSLAQSRENRQVTEQEAQQVAAAYDRYAGLVKQMNNASVARAKASPDGKDPEGEDWTRFDPARAAADLKAGRIAETYVHPKTKKRVINPFFERARQVVAAWEAAQAPVKNAPAGSANAPASGAPSAAGFSPTLKAARQRHINAYAAKHGPPDAAKINELSRLVEQGVLK